MREQRRVRSPVRVGGVPRRAVRTRQRDLKGGSRMGTEGRHGARGAGVGVVSRNRAARVGDGDATKTRRTQAVDARTGIYRALEYAAEVLSIVRGTVALTFNGCGKLRRKLRRTRGALEDFCDNKRVY